MVIAMNYTYRISPGTLLPMVATLPFLRGEDPVTIEAVISGTTGDLHVEVSAIGLGASYLHSCQTFADAGAMADACIEQLVADYGLEPRATVAPKRPKYCEACGDPWAPGGSCGACSRAYHDLAASLGADRLREMRDHSAAHVNDWAVLCRHDVRVGKAESAGRYAVVAARHARRVMRYENALSLCAQEVLQ
jgi:hypothetical protein